MIPPLPEAEPQVQYHDAERDPGDADAEARDHVRQEVHAEVEAAEPDQEDQDGGAGKGGDLRGRLPRWRAAMNPSVP